MNALGAAFFGLWQMTQEDVVEPPPSEPVTQACQTDAAFSEQSRQNVLQSCKPPLMQVLNNDNAGSNAENEGQKPAEDVFFPDGKPIGEKGSREGGRETSGGAEQAEKDFNGVEGKEYNRPGYPGRAKETPGGGFVGLRPKSKSGPPTIDVNIPGHPETKIKYLD